MGIAGIDCSSWQGSAIDWNAVYAAGYVFALIKATEGTTYVNPDFQAQWQSASAAGLVPFAYHFALPDQNRPQDEAAFFLDTVHKLVEMPVGSGFANDLEAGSGDLFPFADGWATTVEGREGFSPFLYSRTTFMAAHGLLDQRLTRCGLWLAQYQQTQPPAPAPWPVTAIWQSGQGSVPGITGLVDLNLFNGDLSQLKKYGKPQPPAPPVPTNDDFEQLHRLVDAQPFAAQALIAYAQRFV